MEIMKYGRDDYDDIDYAWMHDDELWEQGYGYGYGYDYGYGGVYRSGESKAASAGMTGGSWNRYAGSTGYVSYGAYSGGTASTTSAANTKLPPELVKKVAQATGHIYANKEEAMENKENKVNAYFPGVDGWYGVLTRTINGNTIKLIDKLPKCPLVDEIETGIIDYTVTNRIPSWIFRELIGNYAYVNDLQGTEAAAQIYRNNETGEYWIYYPEQVVSAAHVAYDKDPNVKTLRQANTLVMETHSHDSMGAFWSGEDNRNETEAGAYMVIGTLGSNTATYKARVKVGSVYKDMPAYVFFDMTEAEEAEYVKKENWEAKNPENLVNKLTKPTYGYGYGGGYYGSYYNKNKDKTAQTGTASKTNALTKTNDSATNPYADKKPIIEANLENASIWRTFLKLFSNLWSRSALSAPGYNRSKIAARYVNVPVVDIKTKDELANASLVTPDQQIRSEFEKAEIITGHDLDMGAKAATIAYDNISNDGRNEETTFDEDILASFDDSILAKTFSTMDFWELLSQEGKASIALLFDETITDTARSMRDIELDGGACTKFILLLYRARLAPQEELLRMKEVLATSYPEGVSAVQLNRDLESEDIE